MERTRLIGAHGDRQERPHRTVLLRGSLLYPPATHLIGSGRGPAFMRICAFWANNSVQNIEKQTGICGIFGGCLEGVPTRLAQKVLV